VCAGEVEADEDFQPPTVANSSVRAIRRQYIRFLNEAYRAQHGGSGGGHIGRGPTANDGGVLVGRRRPSTHYMSPSAHQVNNSNNSINNNINNINNSNNTASYKTPLSRLELPQERLITFKHASTEDVSCQ